MAAEAQHRRKASPVIRRLGASRVHHPRRYDLRDRVEVATEVPYSGALPKHR